MSGLPDYADALGLALESVRALGASEPVELADAAGRVLASPITADRALPPFDRAERDGYALRASEVGRVERFPVVATIAAGRPGDVAVPPGRCVAIATGAPLPRDVDAVIPHEASDRGDPVRFTMDHVEPGHSVHRCGADARPGDVLVERGAVLGARHMGLAAAVGLSRLDVVRRPRATVLTSGDEVVPPGAPVAGHQVRNSNAPMLAALLAAFGARPGSHAHVADEADETSRAVGLSLRQSDLVVTVGGISAGERDRFPDAFREHEVRLSLRGASIQPGRPVQVGRAPGGAVVLALPGNPVSVLACACLFGWPIVRAMLGLDARLPWCEVELAEAVRPNPVRRAFRPAILLGPGRARVPKWSGSGDLAHTSPTDGLLELPLQPEPVAPGRVLRFLPWP